jgi:hypothetical protein
MDLMFPLFIGAPVLLCAPTDKCLGLEVWRSGWPMLWTTMTNPSACKVMIEMRFHCTAKMGLSFWKFIVNYNFF